MKESKTSPSIPLRVEGFANFFKRYMNVSSVIAASLPIPVAAFKLIPAYSEQTRYLGTYSSMFCFLLLGFVFYMRHSIARLMFENTPQHRFGAAVLAWLPFGLIVTSLTLVFLYHSLLEASIRDVQTTMLQRGIPSYSMKRILAETDSLDIFHGPLLMAVYLAMFLSADAAFILMALREYLQDLLGLTEQSLIFRVSPSAGQLNSDVAPTTR